MTGDKESFFGYRALTVSFPPFHRKDMYMRSLRESQSKRLPAGYGVPAVKEIMAEDGEDAFRAASAQNFPVAFMNNGVKINRHRGLGMFSLLGHPTDLIPFQPFLHADTTVIGA
jgi:hypothetical protein